MAIETHNFDLFYQSDERVALIETINNDDQLLIENLCVASDKQRMGIGRLLLNHAETFARDASYKTMRLDTNKLFQGNVDLYIRHGYVIDWEKPVDGGTHVHMYKSLTL